MGKRSIKETLEYTHMEESEEMKHNGAQTLISGNHSKDAMAAAETRASEQQDNPGQIMVVERKVHHGPMDTTDHSQGRCHGFATSNK